MKDLILTDLSLTGSIPAALGGLADLKRLDLDENALTGNIPSELEGLSDLEHLYLEGNGFTGCIPAGLRDVTVTDLDLLGLSYCATPGSS